MKNIKNKAWMPLLLSTALLTACQDQITSSGGGSSKTAVSSGESVVVVSSSESSVSSASSTSSESSVSSESSESSISSESSESSLSSESSSSSAEKVASTWSEVGGDALKAITEFFQVYDSSATADGSLPFFQTGGKNVEWIVDFGSNPGRGLSLGLVAMTGDDANANKLLVGAYSSTLVSQGFVKLTNDEITDEYDTNMSSFFGSDGSINAYKFANYDDTGCMIEVLPINDIDVNNGYDGYYPSESASNVITSGGIFLYIQGLGA